MFQNNYAIYEFQTTKACRIKLNWKGPQLTKRIFAPGEDIFTGKPVAIFEDSG